MKQYYIYIMTNSSRTLYTGVTDDLVRRVYEHKNKLIEGFTQKYNITRLVYYEITTDVQVAIQREKQIKGWLRKKKIALIEAANSEWKDLSEGWYEEEENFPLHGACSERGRDSSPAAQNDKREGAQSDKREGAQNDKKGAREE